MIRFFQRLMKPGRPVAKASDPRLTLAAFGKHPGWDDYLGKGVDTGIGVDTEMLVRAKDELHSAGIRGQIDSGAWKNLAPDKQLEGFDHAFLWLRAGHVLLGRLWSSADGIGRPYPMVLCADGQGITPELALAKVMSELERLRAACVATNSAEQVTAECRRSQDALQSEMTDAASSRVADSLSLEVRRQFLEHPDLGPDRVGLLRVLHELDAAGQTRERRKASDNFSRHLRVPAAADSPRQSLLLWAEFLRCALPALPPLLLISRGGMGWNDIVIGEPTSADLFCLQASTQAMPLVSHVPYELDPALTPRLQEIEARFLRSENSEDDGLHSVTGANLAQAKGPKLPTLLLAGLALGGLMFTVWAISRNRSSPAEARPGASPRPLATTNARMAIAQGGGKTNAEGSTRPTARLIDEAERRRLTPEGKGPTGTAERVRQEAPIRAAPDQSRKGVETGPAKETVPGKVASKTSQEADNNQAEAEKAQARARETDADLAQISLAQGNYPRALEIAKKWPGDERFQKLVAKVVAETNRLHQFGEFLNAGNYSPLLTNRLPESDRFKELASKAAAEQKVLGQAMAEFAEGKYEFLHRETFQNLKAKPPFQKLLQEGTAEEVQLKKLKELQADGKPREARDLMARNTVSKPPFREIQQWAAGEMERIGQEEKDSQVAKSLFAQAEYAKALDLCHKYPARRAFEALSASISAEQEFLADTQRKYLDGDYSMTGEIQGSACQAKPPFAELLRKAGDEQKSLSELEKLRQADAWQAMPGELSKLPPEVARKKPFSNLRQWAQARALENEKVKLSDPSVLDAEFELLLVRFNVVRPTDPRIHTPQARKETTFGSLGPRGKEFLRRVDWLEEQYRKGGWLNENDRQKLLVKLREAIRYWE